DSAFIAFVAKGGCYLGFFDFLMFIISMARSHTNFMNACERLIVFTAQIYTFAFQCDNRHRMRVLIFVIRIVAFMIAMRAAVQTAAVRMARFVFVTVTGQTVVVFAVRISETKVTLFTNPGGANTGVGAFTKRTVNTRLCPTRCFVIIRLALRSFE